MNVNVTVELKIILSVFEMPTRVTRVEVGACVQMYSSCVVPNVQSNKQNGDDLWLLMGNETRYSLKL